MRKVFAVTAAVALLSLGMAASADVLNMGPGLTSLETVTVGDPGNAGELSGLSGGGSGPDRICGSVSYTYNIGKYEVTAAQYTAFLNAVAKTDTYGLYNVEMWSSSYGRKIQQSGTSGNYSYSVASDRANRPVDYVSFWDACRFANWLHNGQKSGAQDATTTEDGAYALNGYTGTDGRTIQRNTGWTWAVTSEDEWYKAAYYKGGGTNAGYWLYPTQSNSTPGRDMADASGNNANYYSNGYLIGYPYYRTEVGEFQNSDSAYGTFDQCGNVCEWTEAIPYQDSTYAYRGLRGGSYGDNYYLQSKTRTYGSPPYSQDGNIGFRVSQVPEPSSMIALLGLAGLAGMRRRCG